MTPLTKRVLVGYGAFCAINAAVGYFWARNHAPGTNALADLNTKLLRLNALAYLLPQATGASTPATLVPAGNFAPLPAPMVTDQQSGTTTYFGN